jgi:hypothetical protein
VRKEAAVDTEEFGIAAGVASLNGKEEPHRRLRHGGTSEELLTPVPAWTACENDFALTFDRRVWERRRRNNRFVSIEERAACD